MERGPVHVPECRAGYGSVALPSSVGMGVTSGAAYAKASADGAYSAPPDATIRTVAFTWTSLMLIAT
ncbi:MAG: hypothetical protein QGI79_05910, partial [Dehalococcoidia bacterium]|nr:hypothetical protein [Dehalococcoidia bacterium]